jgi:hypothetical protein
VKNWLSKLIGQLRRDRTGLVLLKLSFIRETEQGLPTSGGTSMPTCPLCGVVPLNWDVHNKWCRFVTETKSTQTLLVRTDGAVRSPVDRAKQAAKDQAAKEEQWMRNGCYKDSSGNWVVPDELMWRSLPGGEDR